MKFLYLLYYCGAALLGLTGPPRVLHAADLGGVASPYSAKMEAAVGRVLKQLDSAGQPAPGAEAGGTSAAGGTVSAGAAAAPQIALRCWTTAGNELYIGVEQHLEIQASVAAVKAVLDDMDHYAEIFSGFSDIHILNRDGARSFSYWEQTVPLPFVPNVKYEMIYQTQSPSDTRHVYRYQLRRPSKVLRSDGFIVIAASPDGRKTSFTEYDFFDAEWGSAKVFGPRRLWSSAVEDLALSDFGIKFRTENPKWSGHKVRSQSRHELASDVVRRCVEERKPAEL